MKKKNISLNNNENTEKDISISSKKLESIIDSVVKDHFKLKVRFGSLLILFSIVILCNYLYIILSGNNITNIESRNLIEFYGMSLNSFFSSVSEEKILYFKTIFSLLINLLLILVFTVVLFIPFFLFAGIKKRYFKDIFIFLLSLYLFCIIFVDDIKKEHIIFLVFLYLLLFISKLFYICILDFEDKITLKLNFKVIVHLLLLLLIITEFPWFLFILLAFNLLFIFFCCYCFFYEIFIFILAFVIKYFLIMLLNVPTMEKSNEALIYNFPNFTNQEIMILSFIICIICFLSILGIILKKINIKPFFNRLNIFTLIIVSISIYLLNIIDLNNYNNMFGYSLFLFIFYFFIFVGYIEKEFKKENIVNISILRKYTIILFTYMLYFSVLIFWNNIFINILKWLTEIKEILQQDLFNLIPLLLPLLTMICFIFIVEKIKKKVQKYDRTRKK